MSSVNQKLETNSPKIKDQTMFPICLGISKDNSDSYKTTQLPGEILQQAAPHLFYLHAGRVNLHPPSLLDGNVSCIGNNTSPLTNYTSYMTEPEDVLPQEEINFDRKEPSLDAKRQATSMSGQVKSPSNDDNILPQNGFHSLKIEPHPSVVRKRMMNVKVVMKPTLNEV